MGTVIYAFSHYSSSVTSLETLKNKQYAADYLVDQLKENRFLLAAYARRFVTQNDGYALQQYVQLLDESRGDKARSLETLVPYFPQSSQHKARKYVGHYISDFELLKRQEFTQHELSLLAEVIELSENIIRTEQNAIKQKKQGLQPQREAQSTLISEHYLDSLTAFNSFLDGYQSFFENRINQHYRKIKSDINELFLIVIAILSINILALVFITIVFRSRLARPLDKLNIETKKYLQDVEHFTELKTQPTVYEVEQLTNSINEIFQEISVHIELLEDETIQREKLQIKAEQSNLAKSQFIANTHHEVRTPLNAIIGFNNLLQSTRLEKVQQQYVQNAQGAAKVLLSLFDDISDLSNIDDGHLSLNIQPCNIENVAQYINALMAKQCQSKYLSLLIKIDEDCPVYFSTDEVRLKQILTNLANNAIKYTHQGSIILSIHADHSNQKIRFDIQDTGIGIAQDQIEKILHPFEQADSSSKRQYGGIGLGLTITQKLCQLLSGKLTINAKLNHGSIFSVHLPMKMQSSKTLQDFAIKDVKDISILSSSSDMAAQLCHVLKLIKAPRYSIYHSFEELYCPTTINASILFIEQVFVNRLTKTQFEKLSEHFLQVCIVHEQFQPLSTVPYTLDNVHSIASPFLPSQVSRVLLLANTPSQLDEGPAPWKAIDLTGLQVLLVEDAPMNQLVAQKTLENFNVNVDIAENGEVAVKQLKTKSYDLILMDLHMPVMDGFEATEAIKQCNTSANIPVVGLTADVQEVTRQKCLAIGMEDVITKPFDPVQLAKRLATIKRSHPFKIKQFN